jgi:hypothetical protein
MMTIQPFLKFKFPEKRSMALLADSPLWELSQRRQTERKMWSNNISTEKLPSVLLPVAKRKPLRPRR